MIRIVCTQACVWRRRRWNAGEVTVIPPGGEFPRNAFQYMHKRHPDGPELAPLPQRTGAVLLLGNGPSLEWAISNAHEIPIPVAAVNAAGYKWPLDLAFWISLHPQYFGKWRSWRRRAGYSVDGIHYIAQVPLYRPQPMSVVLDSQQSGGGSALYAAEVLDRIGFSQIILAGVDLTQTGFDYGVFKQAWQRTHLNARVSLPWDKGRRS